MGHCFCCFQGKFFSLSAKIQCKCQPERYLDSPGRIFVGESLEKWRIETNSASQAEVIEIGQLSFLANELLYPANISLIIGFVTSDRFHFHLCSRFASIDQIMRISTRINFSSDIDHHSQSTTVPVSCIRVQWWLKHPSSVMEIENLSFRTWKYISPFRGFVGSHQPLLLLCDVKLK